MPIKGNVKCDNATMETQPFYHQGECWTDWTGFTIAPCKSTNGNFTCSGKEQPTDKLCKGKSYSLEDNSCAE